MAKITNFKWDDNISIEGLSQLPAGFDIEKNSDRVLEIRKPNSAQLTTYRRWLKEHIKGDWQIIKLQIYKEVVTDEIREQKRIWGRGYIAVFDDLTDAMAFKLRWT